MLPELYCLLKNRISGPPGWEGEADNFVTIIMRDLM
jgi:hypothetical protein